MAIPTTTPDPWWAHPNLKWLAMLGVFLGCGFLFLFLGERDAAKVSFGMVVGQAASAGWTATRPKGGG